MTRRTQDHRLATLARSSIEHSLRHLSNGAWLVRSIDQNNEDYGEDIFVQIVDRETPTPWTFFIQVKGTRVFEKHLNREGTIIRDSIDIEHVRLWCSHRQPVFYMIWDESTQNTYWLCIQDFIEELGGGYLVHQDQDGRTLNVLSTWKQLSAFLKMRVEVHGYEPITGQLVPVLPN